MSNAITSPLQATLRQRVSVRTAASGFLPDSQNPNGWVPQPRLRCDSIELALGSRVGRATFTFVPAPGQTREVQQQLAGFSIDDHVRVEVWPLPDLANPELETDAQPIVLFEGELSRPTFSIQSHGQGTQEVLTFTALPFPVCDNLRDVHRVLGRTVPSAPATPSTLVDPVLIESLSLPAIFNHRGRPNRASVKTQNDGGDAWYLFTHDDDAYALPWSVRDALAWLIGSWIYGAGTTILPRRFDIETTSRLVIFGSTAGELHPQFQGLDAALPEVGVQGMGVLDAIEAVCLAGGFRLIIDPTYNADTGYLYHLAIRRRNTGRSVTLDLAHRDTTFSDAEAFVSANNLDKFVGFIDGAEIVNEVRAIGRTFVECALVLKPLWDPADVSGIPITDELQDSPDQDQLQSHPYFSRHVQAGALFATYGSVGRAWGIDCVGDLARPYTLYTEGLYAQTQPFDFVGELGLNNAQVAAWRAEGNLPAGDLRWSSRMRPLGELRSPEAMALRRNFVLEVSEDGGTTWSVLNTVGFTTLARACGISLSIDNLAAVNAAYYQAGDDREMPDIDQSWWALIAQQLLLFRLHCTIEADHALQHIAAPLQSSTRWTRSLQMPVAVDELLVAPGSFFNPGTLWQRHLNPDATAWSVNPATLLRDAAERRRDATSFAQFSASASVAVMDLQRYRLGDQITRIVGREWNLQVNQGNPPRYPMIAALTYQLAGTQGIQVQLEDERMVQGAGGAIGSSTGYGGDAWPA